MSELRKCTRCNDERQTMTMIAVRVGQPSFHMAEPDFPSWVSPSEAAAATVEHVCGDCITDDELLLNRGIGNIVLFATDVLLSRSTATGATALESVRAFFQTFNMEAEDQEKAVRRHRRSAVMALGLDVSKN